MAYATADGRSRLPGALAAGSVQALLAVLLIQGLATHYVGSSDRERETTLVALPERARPPEPPPRHDIEPSGEGAPPARKAEPLPREAPRSKVAVAPARPAASEVGQGVAASPGLAPVPGSGSGAGGLGSGSGMGAGGAGRGSGHVAAPVRIAGAFSDRDYPRSAAARRAAGTAAVSFRVRADGRVDRCALIASTGDAELDALTCTLVERRFVYRPARNAMGEAVDATLRSTFTWGTR